MYVSVWVYVYVSMCVCIYVYMCALLQRFVIKYHQNKQLYMTCGYTTINKTNKQNIHSGG